MELQKDGEKFTESVELYAVKADDQKFNSFLALRNSKKSAIIDLSKNGVAISENIADGYGVAVGDSIVLHMFLVTRINGVAMMFASVIGVGSYFYSLGLTVLFAGIVYAFMLIKLNKINMADSLKSNE